MEVQNLLNLSLPKWPALVVRGKKITKEQATEILIRTDNLRFSSNDHDFVQQLYEYTYRVKAIKPLYHASLHDFFRDSENKASWQQVSQLQDQIATELQLVAPLQYLQNQRIVSSWFGGSHGWCNWDGYIGCNNYNIGKWPSIKEVYEEWRVIAVAFPFLDLRCQLLSGETGEDNNKPVVEFIIGFGQVAIKEPEALLDDTSSPIGDFARNFSNPYRERGCTFEQFKEAIDFVRDKFKVRQLDSIVQ